VISLRSFRRTERRRRFFVGPARRFQRRCISGQTPRVRCVSPWALIDVAFGDPFIPDYAMDRPNVLSPRLAPDSPAMFRVFFFLARFVKSAAESFRSAIRFYAVGQMEFFSSRRRAADRSGNHRAIRLRPSSADVRQSAIESDIFDL